MPIDPFHEPMTVQGQFKRKAEKAWPSIYNLINHLFWALVDGLKAMAISVYESLKP